MISQINVVLFMLNQLVIDQIILKYETDHFKTIKGYNITR